MFGADVAQLRQAAAQFDRHAQQLDADRMTVGNAIRISAWVGPFATSFRMQWDSEHSRRMHDAAMRLRDAAQKLRSNADEQERASAADGGNARSGSAGTSRPIFDPRHMSIIPEDAPGFRDRTKHLRVLWTGMRQILQSELPSTGWSVSDLAGLIPHVGTGVDVYSAIDKAANGQLPWHEAIDIAAGAARGSGNPILFGLGWTAANAADAVEQMGKVDWSAKGMDDLIGGLFSADGWKEVGHEMVTTLPRLLAGNTIP